MVAPTHDPRTLADVLDLVDRTRRDNRDHYLHLRDLRFDVTDPSPRPLHEQLTLACDEADAPPRIALRETGLGRLFRFLGLPTQFGDKLPASMVANSLNYVLQSRADEMVLVRVRHQDDRPLLRGLLPAGHVRLDDTQILRQLARLSGAADLRPVNVSVREDTFHLRLIERREVNVGRAGDRDPVHPGLDVFNSETGAGALAVGRCLFRVVCANGLLFREDGGRTRRWRHSGRDREVLRHQLAEALRLSVAEVRGLVARYRDLHAVEMREPAALLDTFMRRHKLGSPRGRTGERIILEMSRTGDLFGQSLFDFVQAVTAVARTLDTEKRLKFEVAAGKLVAEGGVGEAA